MSSEILRKIKSPFLITKMVKDMRLSKKPWHGIPIILKRECYCKLSMNKWAFPISNYFKWDIDFLFIFNNLNNLLKIQLINAKKLIIKDVMRSLFIVFFFLSHPSIYTDPPPATMNSMRNCVGWLFYRWNVATPKI